jgi:hypothetical protein
LTSPVECITPDATLLIDGVAQDGLEITTMWQRLKLLTVLLGVFLSRRHGRALLARVHASNLGEADRDLVTRILRAALRLPEAPVPERFVLDAPAAPASRDPDCHAS